MPSREYGIHGGKSAIICASHPELLSKLGVVDIHLRPTTLNIILCRGLNLICATLTSRKDATKCCFKMYGLDVQKFAKNYSVKVSGGLLEINLLNRHKAFQTLSAFILGIKNYPFRAGIKIQIYARWRWRTASWDFPQCKTRTMETGHWVKQKNSGVAVSHPMVSRQSGFILLGNRVRTGSIFLLCLISVWILPYPSTQKFFLVLQPTRSFLSSLYPIPFMTKVSRKENIWFHGNVSLK